MHIAADVNPGRLAPADEPAGLGTCFIWYPCRADAGAPCAPLSTVRPGEEIVLTGIYQHNFEAAQVGR